MSGKAGQLEILTIEVPRHSVPTFEAVFDVHCATVGVFGDDTAALWTIEGMWRSGDVSALELGLALAATATGIAPPCLRRGPARPVRSVSADFPPQRIGRRWLVLGTHDAARREAGRIPIVMDAGLAFGSGEHGSTRGCLRALDGLRLPAGNILDLGTGSAILAIACAKRFRRRVLATDIEPCSVLVATANARANRVGRLVRAVRENGVARRVSSGRPYGLVLANILARPLCAMARPLAARLAPGARVVLAGLLDDQANQVGVAWRRRGIVLRRRLYEGRWTTLVLQAPGRSNGGPR